MASREKICRLCLNLISDSFEILDHHKLDMLASLSLDLDLSITHKPLVCFECRDCLQESCNFKMTCLNNAYYVENFVSSEERNTTQTAVNSPKENTCQFCSKNLDNDSSVKFNVEKDAFLKDMLYKCFPELKPNDINKLLLCYDCLKNCQNMFNFVVHCLNMEKKIIQYVQRNGTTSKGIIYLSNVLKCIHDPQDNDEITVEDMKFIKEESLGSTSCGTLKTCEKVKDSIIKEPLNNTNCDGSVKKETLKQEVDDIDIKYEDHRLLEAETAIVSDSSQENPAKVRSKTTVYRCPQCNYVGKTKSYLRKHMLNHKDASEVRMHKCTQCEYESRRRPNLLRHMLKHQEKSESTLYKCSQCNYETKHKECLRQHLLVHREYSEIVWHKCTVCDFETKRKQYLRKHLLTHRDQSEGTVYKCAECGLETRYKCSLRTHLMTHKNQAHMYVMIDKDNSAQRMHRCTLCDYESRYKSELLKHLSVHNSDVAVHE